MNDLGVLATDIVTYDFPNDTGSYNVGFVSGWLETNIGELNGLVHEEFEANATGGLCLVGTDSGMMPVEKNIFSTLYYQFNIVTKRILRLATFAWYLFLQRKWLVAAQGLEWQMFRYAVVYHQRNLSFLGIQKLECKSSGSYTNSKDQKCIDEISMW